MLCAALAAGDLSFRISNTFQLLDLKCFLRLHMLPWSTLNFALQMLH